MIHPTPQGLETVVKKLCGAVSTLAKKASWKPLKNKAVQRSSKEGNA